MRTLIIEDEGAARRRLERIVENHPKFNFTGSAASGAQAVELIKTTEADLLLMDIQLKDMTAFEVLNKIDKDFSGRIIFVTAYNDFAIKAFDVFAIDYVLKPYSEERLLNAMNRCLTTRKSLKKEMYAILESLHFPNKICIPEGKTSHLYENDQIEWIKADGYHCEIYTDEGKVHLIRILLKDVHQLLPDNFVRISRSVILNKNYVVAYRENSNDTVFIMKCGKEFYGKTGYSK